MATAIKRQKIELSYLDGDNMQSYTMQMNEDEYNDFNKQMLRHHGRVDVVGLALKGLVEMASCTKHHKTKINEILDKTMILNFRYIEG